MGSPSASGPSSGPAGRKTDGTYGTKKDAEQTRLENFQQGAINRTKETVAKAPVLAAKILSPIAVYGADVNSKFFTDKVLTSSKAKKNIGYTQSEFAALTADQQNKVFSKYMSGRQSGQLDAYGNLTPGDGGNDGNNTIAQVTKTAPTTAEVTKTAPTEAEVSQATTTTAAAAETAKTTEANRLLKIKKKGRSQSIITGSKGVTKTSTDYSLGKKSLLGRI
jgi:hypothetical protein